MKRLRWVGTLAMILFTAPVFAATVVISPSNMNGWGFLNETPTGSGSLVAGPLAPPLGAGSAQLIVNATGGHLIGTQDASIVGLRFDDITSLSYSTFRASGGVAVAPALQFNVDYDLTDMTTSWQGRLVFEPYLTGSAVSTGAWQTWTPMTYGTGGWWATGAPGNGVCPQASPCTWAQVLSNFPNAGVQTGMLAGMVIKVGGGSGGFTGNVDDVVLGISGSDTTYDFEPDAVVVSPSNMNGWAFLQEGASGTGELHSGPGTTPLGSGSARITVDATGRYLIGSQDPSIVGLPFSQITGLSYATYRTVGSAPLAMTVAFNVDYDLTDMNTAWQGRLTFEPYLTGSPVTTGVWQYWTPLTYTTGAWWASGAPGNGVCPQAAPCTWAQVLSNFPNAGVQSGALAGMVLRAGGPWAGGFDGNVDRFALGIAGVETAYDFEPDCADRYVETTGADASNDCTDSMTPCLTVQRAVNEACAGDTIFVGSGTFAGQVTIDKTVSVQGNGTAATTISAPGSPLTGDLAIVTIQGAGTDVEMTDLAVAGPGPGGCGSISYGIFVRDDAHANIHDTEIRDIRDNPFSGCQNGIGLQVGRNFVNTSGTADITDNTIIGYQKNGITVDRTGSSATITGNTVTGAGPTSTIAQNGIQVSRGAVADLTCNVVTGNQYVDPVPPVDASSTGLLDYQSGVPALSLLDNILEDNDVNAYFNDTGCGQPCNVGSGSANPIVRGNSITGATLYSGVSDGVVAGIVSGPGGYSVDAEDNWWGAVDGPSDQAPGSGDGVYADPGITIDFMPFETADIDPDSDNHLRVCGDTCPDDSDNDSDSDGYCVGATSDAPKVGGNDNCPIVANPTQTDFDTDTTGDACDTCTDTDGDTFGNPGYAGNTCATDNCPVVANMSQTDTDADTSGDACDTCTDTDGDAFGDPGFAANTCGDDNCPSLSNPSQTNADGDTDGDACDTCTDTDGDTFGNPGYAGNTCATDNCPVVANMSQTDTDADTSGDACDTCTDTDGDAFGDPGFAANTCGTDNCPTLSNPLQTNADGDANGDACDTCTDTDGDGFGNPGYPANTCTNDNCPSIANPTQADVDNDGSGDACDGSTSPASLTAGKLRLRVALNPLKPTGSAKVKAVVNDNDTSGTLTANLLTNTAQVTIVDNSTSYNVTKTLSGCTASGSGRVRCKSLDGTVKAVFAPYRVGPNLWKMNVRVKSLAQTATGTSPTGPVSVTLAHGSVTRVDTIGNLVACAVKPNGLACKEP